MTDAPQFVEIFTANDDQPEVARKLLEAAGDAPEQVATVFGGFRVPVAIAEAAGFSATDTQAVDAAAVEGQALDSTTTPTDGDTDGDGPDDGDGPEAPAADPAPAAEPTPEPEPAPEATPVPERAPEPEPAPTAEDEPKGAALDAALRDAGLSTEGKADEKRARLAAHRATQQ